MPENRSLFFSYQQRLVQLVMSIVFDQKITSVISDVLYECSLGETLINKFTPSEKDEFNFKLDEFSKKEEELKTIET